MTTRDLWIRALIKLYPAPFRRRYGHELRELYSDLGFGVFALTWDLIANAVRVRLDDAGERRPFRPGPRRRFTFLDGLRSDVGSSWRGFVRRPAFTALVIVTLALGIGANTAIFTVMHWVVLRPLPYPRADELVRVWWQPGSFNQRIVALFQERAHSLSGLSAFSGWSFTLTGEGEPEELSGAVVSPNHFAVLEVSPILGRAFEVGDGEPGRSDVCILSRGLWVRRFGGNEDVLGRRIELAGAGRNGCTVIGVVSDAHAAIDSFGPRQAFLPLARAADLENDDSWFLSAIGRLREGGSLEEANAEVRDLARVVRAEMYPRTSEEEIRQARVETLRDAMVGDDLRGELFLLVAAAAIVLLVACGNLSTLLLARYAERERELAVRSALGAKSARVFRLLLTESIALGLAGGVLGTLLATAAVKWASSRLPADLPRADGIGTSGPDTSVLLFAMAASVAATLAFGLLPALRASRKVTASPSLRSGARAGERHRHRLDRWLVAGEVASSIVLLTAAGIVLGGFLRLLRVDPGFDFERVLVAGVQAPETSYSDERKRQLFRELRETIESIPGVERAGSIHLLPFEAGNWDFPFYPEGWVLGPSEPPPKANFRVISPGYFGAMGVSLLEGRDVADSDRASAASVGLVNESFARRIWPNETAIGKEIRIFGSTGPLFTVVGVVGDVHQHGLAVEPVPEMYRPLEQWSLGRNYIMIRAARGPESLAAAVRDAIWSVDADVPIVRLSPMSEVVSASVATSRATAVLVTTFAGLALVLAGVGVYGVASAIAAARVQEIGIRLALGASAGAVVRRILAQGMLPLVPGVLVGLVVARGASGLLTSLLPDVTTPEPAILAAVAIFLAVVGFAASYVPARRASRIDPITTLRQE